MQLEQRFELPAPPERAWPAFKDIEALVACLPGASLTGPAVDGELPLRLDVRLGPIAAAFAGSGRVSLDDGAHRGRFEGSAADRKTQSRVKGAADFALTAGGAGTVVSVTVDYALTGSLAQFGRGGIVRELAAALTAQFAANLAQRLAPAPSPPATPTSGTAAAAATAAMATAPPRAQPLSVGRLIGLALQARWRRLLRWLGAGPA